jgi:hypothetical protein
MAFILIVTIRMGGKILLPPTAVELDTDRSYEDLFARATVEMSHTRSALDLPCKSLHVDLIKSVRIYPITNPAQTITISSVDMKTNLSRDMNFRGVTFEININRRNAFPLSLSDTARKKNIKNPYSVFQN